MPSGFNMADHFKDIPVTWYAAAALPVLGWIRSAFKAGQRMQKIDSKLENIQATGATLSTSVKEIHQRINKLERDVGKLEGKVE